MPYFALGANANSCVSGAAILALTAKGNFGDALTALQAMQFGGAAIFAAKFAIAFPFTFHLFNGIRHLVRMQQALSWDYEDS